MKPKAWSGTAAALCALLLVPSALSATPWTPFPWQSDGKLRSWSRDANGNFVDDLIETSKGPQTVIVDLNRCAGDPTSSALLQFLKTKGDVSYVGKYLSFVVVTGVEPAEAAAIAKRPEVAMVESDVPLKWLDVERQAMKVENSTAYPNNLSKKGWSSTLNGKGVNVAILDSGVDNTHAELTGRYRYGFNAMTNTEENPSGTPSGHGTWMARFAVGTGSYGIAPGAGLVDVKIGSDSGGGTTAYLATALEKVLEKQKAWNIGIVNLSVTYALAPPYKNDGNEALSWLVNRVVAAGIVVVAAAGNGAAQGDNEIAPPGTASWAITVGAADPGTTVLRTDDVIANSTYGPRLNDGDQDKLDELKPEIATSSDSATSPATARTSGLAALILQKASGINPGSLKDLLIRTAEDLDTTADTTVSYPKSTPTWDKKWGYGLTDADAAVTNLNKSGAPDLTFKGYDGSSHPSLPWYLSRAVRVSRQSAVVDTIVANQPHSVCGNVWNKSGGAAQNVRVNFAFYQLTAGIPRFYDIGSVFLATLAAGQVKEACIAWTPTSLQAGYEHGCLEIAIDYGLDASFANRSNVAQRNIKVKTTSSPAVFNFRVENPLPGTAAIELKVTGGSPGWTLALSQTAFTLAPADCAKVIQATAQPPAGAQKGDEALFFVTAVALERGSEQALEIGGVALKAVYSGDGRPSWLWWLILLILVLLALALGALMLRGRHPGARGGGRGREDAGEP
jgi:hypothetical protein